MEREPVSSRKIRALFEWLLVCAVFVVIVVTAGTSVSSVASERLIYQLALFPLCSFPFIVLGRIPSFRLVAFFMAVYYALFGLLDFVLMFTESQYQIYEASLKIQKTQLADTVILLGGGSLLLVYVLVAGFWRTPVGATKHEIWDYKKSLIVGAISWLIGIWCYFVVQFIYAEHGPKEAGWFSIVISNLYYLALLGDIVLVVTAVTYQEKKAPWVLISMVIAVEYVFGFLGNIKEVSYRTLALILIAQFFSKGRINLKLVAFLILSFVPYQALFNVYREQVLQVRQQSAVEAASAADKSTNTVLTKFRQQRDSMIRSSFIMLDRIDARKYVEIITQKVGGSVPFQEGETLKLLLYAFVPRTLWPEKPQISTGQLMNQTFKLSASKATFVPSTILGEFYWNYGMTGVVIGMSLLGGLFATINCACLRAKTYSTTGMLTVLVATYFLVARFEASVGSQFSQFIRVILILWTIDWIIGVLGWKHLLGKVKSPDSEVTPVRFPNVMRGGRSSQMGI